VKKTALAAACLIVVGPALSVQAAQRGTGKKAPAQVNIVPGDAQFVIGTVTYDTGTNAGFHPDVPAGSPNLNRTVGNRFNSALGGPLLMTNAMVTRLTVFPAQSGGQSVSIAVAPNVSGVAAVLDYQNANLMAGAFNQIVLTAPVPVPPDFIAMFLGTFTGTNAAGLLGMSDMSVNGQGFHAIEGFYAAGNQTMVTVVPNRNGMIRAFGDILTPVELMDFKIL
jgi:hypothetical protein